MQAKWQDLSKFKVPEGFRGKSKGIVQLWWLVQSTAFALSPQPFYGWRNWLLRLFGAEIGTGVRIRASARVTYPWKIKIGDNSWIGDRTELYSLYNISIGSNTCVSQDCYLCTGSHDQGKVDFSYACAEINIGDQVWLAAGNFIGPGVDVGYGTVVGARSVVLKSLRSESLYAGHPVRYISERRK